MTRRIVVIFAVLVAMAIGLGFYALHLKRKVARDEESQPNNSWRWPHRLTVPPRR